MTILLIYTEARRQLLFKSAANRIILSGNLKGCLNVLFYNKLWFITVYNDLN